MESKSSTLGLNSKFRIGILTSSRADFGIYYPLLRKLKSNSLFDIEIINAIIHITDRLFRYGQKNRKFIKDFS